MSCRHLDVGGWRTAETRTADAERTGPGPAGFTPSSRIDRKTQATHRRHFALYYTQNPITVSFDDTDLTESGNRQQCRKTVCAWKNQYSVLPSTFSVQNKVRGQHPVDKIQANQIVDLPLAYNSFFRDIRLIRQTFSTASLREEMLSLFE